MNRVTRNIAAVLGAALASLLTASVLLFFEARTGQPLFSYSVADYIPAGAVAAGIIASAGLLGGGLILRLRPAPVVAIGLVLVSAGTIYLVQSAQLTLQSAGRVAAMDPGSFVRFLAYSTMHSPLQFGDPHSGSSTSSASSALNPNAARAIPQMGAEGDSNVQSISSGVQGVVASQDMGTSMASGTQQRISQFGDGIQGMSSAVQNHGTQWLVMALQIGGFSIGGLLVYSFLRSRPFCDDCSLLLRSKGAQTRYFSRLDEINGSVEDVISKAKDRRLQLAVQSHGARGAAKKDKQAAFASTVQVSRCMRCHAHRMDFRAMRKSGVGWKDIPVLGYTASSYEPIEVAG